MMIEEHILQTFDGKIVKDSIQIRTCPFCDNFKYNLEISLVPLERYGNIRTYHCWSCDASGSLEKFCRLFNIPYDEEPHYRPHTVITADPIIQLPPEFKLLNPVAPKSLYEINAISYLHSRNIKDSVITRFKIGYCSAGNFECRLIFPVYEQDELIYFTTRGYWYKENSKPLHIKAKKKSILYNFNVFYENIVLVEGVFDAFSVIQCGYNGVALLGKKLYPGQIKKIFGSNIKTVKILLDNEATNQQRKDIYNSLNVNRLNIDIIKIKEKGDPNSISQQKLKKYLTN